MQPFSNIFEGESWKLWSRHDMPSCTAGLLKEEVFLQYRLEPVWVSPTDSLAYSENAFDDSVFVMYAKEKLKISSVYTTWPQPSSTP